MDSEIFEEIMKTERSFGAECGNIEPMNILLAMMGIGHIPI